MALVEIRASFVCDGCGTPFSLRMEPNYEPPEGWSLYDIAEDSLRGSVDYVGPRTSKGIGGSSSVQDGKQLCGQCTEDADESEASP